MADYFILFDFILLIIVWYYFGVWRQINDYLFIYYLMFWTEKNAVPNPGLTILARAVNDVSKQIIVFDYCRLVQLFFFIHSFSYVHFLYVDFLYLFYMFIFYTFIFYTVHYLYRSFFIIQNILLQPSIKKNIFIHKIWPIT